MGKVIKNKIRGMNLWAKIGLVLTLTLALGTFMYKVSESTPTANGRLLFSNSTTTPQVAAYTASTNTFAAAGATVAGAAQTFMVDRASATRNEHIAGYVTTGGVLYIYRWNGSTWINETAAAGGWGGTVTVGGNGVDGRRFDIAYEKTTGNAMVVYSTNTTTSGGNKMAYRTWNGATWSAATNISCPWSNIVAAVTWVKLKSNPVGATNEIALTACDTGTTTANTANLNTHIWNGSTWTAAATSHTASATATLPNTTGQLMQNDCFDMAYESTSGGLFVVFTTASVAQQYYRTYSAGTWGNATSYATGRAAPLQMIAESDPQSDQILVMWTRSGSPNVYANVWTGSAVGTTTTVVTTGVAPSVNKKTISGKWLFTGGISYAIALSDTTTAGTIGYGRFTGGTWTTAQTYASGIGAAVNWMDTDVDPQGADTMMLTMSTGAAGTGSLWAKRLVISAGPTMTWTNADGGTAETTALASATSKNFAFEYDRYIPPLPTVSSTSPNAMVQGEGPTTVTITGQYFTGATAVSFNDANITVGAITVVNDTTITVPVTVAAATTAAAKNVSVTTPNGTGTGTGVFTVTAAPAPTVTSTTPSSMAQGAGPTTVTITGTNFLSGATVAFSGTGITLGAVTYVNATTLTVPVTVAAGATLGARDVTVTLPGGQTGTGTGVFTVTAPVPPPTVTSTSPSSMVQGEGPTTVTITGTNFTGATAVSFNDANITVGAITVVNDTTITVPVTVAPATTASAKDVSVTNPGGTGTGTGVFTVNAAPAPTVTSTSPSSMGQGTGPTTVTITGTNFLSGATVAFSGAGITLGAVTYVNATTLTVPVTVAAGATLGAGNVTVTLPGGQTGTGTGVFTVTGPPQPSTISICGGCHGYPGTSNPFVDVAGRNPDPVQGRFSGSHEVHTTQYPYTCSRCHVAPATETSADYAHSRGSITMANPLNANTGAKYGKGTTWAITNTPTTYLNCSATYCHSNGTSVATGKIYTNISSPRWGKRLPANTCNVCHGVGGPTTGAPNYPNLKKKPTAATAGWTNPNNALLEDPNYATYAGTAQTTLILTNFGYTTTDVADTDTVTGITVAVKGWAASGTAPGNQLNVQLTQNGTAGAGTAKTISLPGTTSAANNEVITTIVPTDLWGTTWTPAQIRATTFGVILKDNDTTSSQLNVDVVKVIIHTDKSPKMNSHASHAGYTCEKCHFNVTTDGSTIATPGNHVAGSYSLLQGGGATFTYTYNAAASTCSTIGCHADGVWGVDNFDCVSCHSVTITRTKGRPGTTLAAASLEFGQTWGHKRNGRGAVTPSDCVVCHLEGNFTTGKASIYHQDGNIDLRDPDGAGETPITNISNAAWTFQRFSTSFAAASRFNDGHTRNNIDNIITIKFCMKCHDSDGATNTTARSNNPGTGTAAMPFGGVSLGAAYTATNGAIGTQGLVNVATQFASANSSRHPVGAPNNRAYPYSTRLVAPYNNFGTTRDANIIASAGATPRVKANSVVIYCFDCHNTSPRRTLRTVSAHGNTVTLWGTFWTTGSTVSTPTLCLGCHGGVTTGNTTTSYMNTTNGGHNNGSAISVADANINNVMDVCSNCHFSAYNDPGRPIRAADVHGFNGLLATGGAWTYGASNGMRPVAFMRNVAQWTSGTATSPRPYQATLAGPGQFNLAAGTPSCSTAGVAFGANTQCSSNTHSPYAPGGSY